MGWTYRLEFVNCGKCRACRGGAYIHGPYWYAYRRQTNTGKLKKVYVGKRKQEYKERADSGSGPDPKSAGPSFSGRMNTDKALGILGLQRSASAAEVKRRWRSLVQDHHPDAGGSLEVCAAINAACTFLKNNGWA